MTHNLATKFKKREPVCMTTKLEEINLPSLNEEGEHARLTLFRDIFKNDSIVKLSSYTKKKQGI